MFLKNIKLIKANKPEGKLAEVVLTSLLDHMNNGFAARTFERNSKEDPIIKNLFLLTDKQMIYVANIDERFSSIELFEKAGSIADKTEKQIDLDLGLTDPE